MDIDYDKYSEHLDRCNEIEAFILEQIEEKFPDAPTEVIGAAFINVLRKLSEFGIREISKKALRESK